MARARVLFLAANPQSTSRLALDEELRAIQGRLREGGAAAHIQLHAELALRAEELPAALMRHRPHIVHFSGHGSQAGELYLSSNNTDDITPVAAETLQRVFEPLAGDIACVVLNACYSAAQAEALIKVLPCVVGMTKAVKDTAAIAFSAGFYEALVFGKSVEIAFKLGCARIALAQQLGQQDIPKLLLRPGSDPSQLRPFGPPPDDEQARSDEPAAAVSYGAALGAALKLDRTSQWQEIVERSRQSGSIIYLLYGQRERAGLAFFVDRICRFLAPAQGDRHRIFKVPFIVDGIGARTGEDWALRLHTELATSLGRHGEVPLRDLLRLATARQPFFILLGRFPLPPLDEAEEAGLEEFLSDLLPSFLRDVPYVRILLAHDYERPALSQVKKLDVWMHKGALGGKYKCMLLDEAVLPSWDDVQRYLSRDKEMSPERIAALKPEYDRLRSRKTLSYETLATFLDRKLDT